MKSIMCKIALVVSMAMASLTVFGQFVQPQFVPPPTRFDTDPAQTRLEAENREQQAAIAAQQAADKKAAQEAAAQAEHDAIVAKLTGEKDDAIYKISAKYTPGISDLESQDSMLKQKAAQLEAEKSRAESENAHIQAKLLFQPKDQWRNLDGKICNAKDKDWLHFNGRVLEVKTNGILIAGDFGPPLEPGFGERNYFVENFPSDTYAFADGEELTTNMNFVAHLGGKTTFQFTHSKIDLGVETVRRLDYGKIVTSPPADLVQKQFNINTSGIDISQLAMQLDANTKEQSEIESKLSQVKGDFAKESDAVTQDYEVKIQNVPAVLAKLAKEKEDEKKRAVLDKVLKFNQDAADKGDPYGLLRMGERYRDGDGVPKDLVKAKDYLTKAAATGSPTADSELKNLPTN